MTRPADWIPDVGDRVRCRIRGPYPRIYGTVTGFDVSRSMFFEGSWGVAYIDDDRGERVMLCTENLDPCPWWRRDWLREILAGRIVLRPIRRWRWRRLRRSRR